MKNLLLTLLLGSSVATATSEADKKLWLDTHNAERAHYGVEPLIWSPQLKMASKRWANQLAKTCGPLEHSPTRKDTGENIAGSGGTVHPVNLPVEWWIKEKKWYDYVSNTCEPVDNKGEPLPHKSCLHWRQVASARSELIGCAKSSCTYTERGTKSRRRYTYTKTYYVCQYQPHGNMNTDTTRPYSDGGRYGGEKD